MSFTEAYCWRGFAKDILKDYQGSLLDLNKAIDLDPNFGEAYAYRGITIVYLGNKSKVCFDFKKAQALGIERLLISPRYSAIKNVIIELDQFKDAEKGAKGLDSLYSSLCGWVPLHGDRKRCANSDQTT